MDIEEKRKALEAARQEQEKAERAIATRDAKARELDDAAAAARERVAASEKQLREAELEALRRRLEKAEAAAAETRGCLCDALGVLGALAADARSAQAEADQLRAQLGIPVGRDQVEAAIVGALVDAKLVDARSLGVPVTTLRRLDPAREDERRRRAESDRAAREEADRAYSEREDVLLHEIAVLDRKIAARQGDLRRLGASRALQARLDEAVRERDALVAKAASLGYDVEVDGELVAATA